MNFNKLSEVLTKALLSPSTEVTHQMATQVRLDTSPITSLMLSSDSLVEDSRTIPRVWINSWMLKYSNLIMTKTLNLPDCGTLRPTTQPLLANLQNGRKEGPKTWNRAKPIQPKTYLLLTRHTLPIAALWFSLLIGLSTKQIWVPHNLFRAFLTKRSMCRSSSKDISSEQLLCKSSKWPVWHAASTSRELSLKVLALSWWPKPYLTS